MIAVGITLGACGDSAQPPGVTPDGFDAVRAVIEREPGEPSELCLWLADTGERRSRGLMGVTDLAGADGMAFVYDQPRTTEFTMRNTVVGLSIAFFDQHGWFIDAFDMDPCVTEPCPTYPTPEGFSVAVEVFRGELDARGMTVGSRLSMTAQPCDVVRDR